MTILEENLTNTDELPAESEIETASERCLRMLAMHELEQNGPSFA